MTAEKEILNPILCRLINYLLLVNIGLLLVLAGSLRGLCSGYYAITGQTAEEVMFRWETYGEKNL